MTETELARILHSIDEALAIYQQHSGALSAAEVSVKSMLTVVRAQVGAQLQREIAHSRGENKG